MTSVTTKSIKDHLDDVLERVTGKHERVRITRRGKTVAVIVPVEDYEYWAKAEAEEEAEDIRLADEEMRAYELDGESIPWEKIKKENGL